MDFSRKTGAQRSRIHEEETEGYYIFFLLLLIGPQLEFRQFVTNMRKVYAWAEFSYTALSGYSLGLHSSVQNQCNNSEL